MPSSWRQWFKGSNRSVRRGRTLTRASCQFRPSGEGLEDRQLLAIVVTPHGGPVIQSVQVVTIYWGWNFANAQFTNLANNLDGYFGYLTGNNSWMNGLAVWRGGHGELRQDRPHCPQCTGRGGRCRRRCTGCAHDQRRDHEQGGPSPRCQYALRRVHTAGGQRRRHQSVQRRHLDLHKLDRGQEPAMPWLPHLLGGAAGQPSFAYAVMAFPDASIGAANYLNGAAPKSVSLSAFNVQNDLTIVASHELAEAVTDPIIYASPTGGYFANGWYYNPNLATTSGGSEIGDLTVGQNFILDGRYWVQHTGRTSSPSQPIRTRAASGRQCQLARGDEFAAGRWRGGYHHAPAKSSGADPDQAEPTCGPSQPGQHHVAFPADSYRAEHSRRCQPCPALDRRQ